MIVAAALRHIDPDAYLSLFGHGIGAARFCLLNLRRCWVPGAGGIL